MKRFYYLMLWSAVSLRVGSNGDGVVLREWGEEACWEALGSTLGGKCNAWAERLPRHTDAKTLSFRYTGVPGINRA